MPEFRRPRARRAQATEVWLGILLGTMLIGLGALIHKFDVVPQPATTVLAQLTQASLGHDFLFYAVQLITMVLLALAANTSFGGLPVLAALLGKDNYLPHMFGLRADRQVHRYGVVTLALLAAALLVASRGDTQALVPLFAIGVFVGFTLSQVGMVRHWSTERSAGWVARAAVNGAGAEVQPPRFWDYLLFNQRGVILERAIRRDTGNVVLCRLRYRLEHFGPRPGPSADSAEPAPQDRRAHGGGRADGRDGGQARVLGGGGEDMIGHPEQPPER